VFEELDPLVHFLRSAVVELKLLSFGIHFLRQGSYQVVDHLPGFDFQLKEVQIHWVSDTFRAQLIQRR
jgi:hypothetical protein